MTKDLIAERNARRRARYVAKPAPLALVGDVLTEMIREKTGKPPCQNYCKATAAKMNDWGVAKCRENVDELAEELHQNVKRMGWTESIRTAAIKVVDGVAHALTGNDVYRDLIIKACDECDRRNGDNDK